MKSIKENDIWWIKCTFLIKKKLLLSLFFFFFHFCLLCSYDVSQISRNFHYDGFEIKMSGYFSEQIKTNELFRNNLSFKLK